MLAAYQALRPPWWAERALINVPRHVEDKRKERKKKRRKKERKKKERKRKERCECEGRGDE